MSGNTRDDNMPHPDNEAINRIMERATIFATENVHEYLTVEHLLWSLLHEKELQHILTEVGGRPRQLRPRQLRPRQLRPRL